MKSAQAATLTSGEIGIPAATVSSLNTSGVCPGVRVVSPGHVELLAEVLGTAARALRADKGYQREPGVWTAHTFGLEAHGDGTPEDALSDEALPVAGLVRPRKPCSSSVPRRIPARSTWRPGPRWNGFGFARAPVAARRIPC